MLPRKNFSYLKMTLMIVMLAQLSACGTPNAVSMADNYYKISGASISGVLSIKRVELSFSSGLNNITVKQGQKITAEVIIKYSGSGSLLARWLVDGQVIAQENIFINRGSLLKLSLNPTVKIPNFIAGKHLLQFEIIQPASAIKIPVISYFVTAG